jgi:dTDP-4-dehydrorhamnose 3,5-epimerase-like enzyme
MKHVRLIELDYYKECDGDLVVAEECSKSVAFSIARVFSVRANKGCTRGRHAHRECTQLLVCTNGEMNVICDDGSKTASYTLNKANYGLLIEPGIWAEQNYTKDNTVLTVLCNRKYNESDYIREREVFLKYKGLG